MQSSCTCTRFRSKIGDHMITQPLPSVFLSACFSALRLACLTLPLASCPFALASPFRFDRASADLSYALCTLWSDCSLALRPFLSSSRLALPTLSYNRANQGKWIWCSSAKKRKMQTSMRTATVSTLTWESSEHLTVMALGKERFDGEQSQLWTIANWGTSPDLL